MLSFKFSIITHSSDLIVSNLCPTFYYFVPCSYVVLNTLMIDLDKSQSNEGASSSPCPRLLYIIMRMCGLNSS